MVAGGTPANETDSFTVTVAQGQTGFVTATFFSALASESGSVPITVANIPISPAQLAVSPVRINVGAYPTELAVSPNGSIVYVTYEQSGTVSVIDTATQTVIDTIDLNNGPIGSFLSSGVAFRPDGGVAYVANSNNGTVSVIDPVTHTSSTPSTLATAQAVGWRSDPTAALPTSPITLMGRFR